MATELTIILRIKNIVRENPWCCLIFALGVGWTVYLQTFIPDEVFFSGDGGVKSLMVRQLCRGDFRIDLNLPAEPWVRQLWLQGYYPFVPPIAYLQDGRYQIAFHFLFPLISAPFYKWLGYRGLTVLPLLSTWLIWITLLRLCRRWELSDRWSAISLTTLIFTTPLTLYSAMFWEHTMGVLLGTCGLLLLLHLPDARSLHYGVWSGICLGLSIWFRSELYCFAALCVLAGVLFYRSIGGRRRLIAFFSALAGTLVIFWGLNLLIYHHPFGVQSRQVIDNLSLASVETRYPALLKLAGLFLYEYSRLVLFYAIAVPIALVMTQKKTNRRLGGMVFLIAMLFFVASPLILPNYGGKQWGPRYLLILLPILAVQSVWAMKVLFARSREWMLISLVAFLYCFALGTWVNAYQGAIVLKSDYRERELPSLQYLRKSESRIVLVSNAWLAQELAAAIPAQSFFRIRDWNKLEELIPVIWRHGHDRLVVVTDLSDAPPTNRDMLIDKVPIHLSFRFVKRTGENLLFEGRITTPSAFSSG